MWRMILRRFTGRVSMWLFWSLPLRMIRVRLAYACAHSANNYRLKRWSWAWAPPWRMRLWTQLARRKLDVGSVLTGLKDPGTLQGAPKTNLGTSGGYCSASGGPQCIWADNDTGSLRKELYRAVQDVYGVVGKKRLDRHLANGGGIRVHITLT